jgi:hypothetical protein
LDQWDADESSLYNSQRAQSGCGVFFNELEDPTYHPADNRLG